MEFFQVDKVEYDRQTNVGLLRNAVRIQLWTAIIPCLISAKIKAELQTPYSITEIACILCASAFTKTLIRKFLTNNQLTIDNRNIKGLKLFY